MTIAKWLLYTFLVISVAQGCMPGKEANRNKNIPAIVTFTDSMDASQLIVTDEVDGFFNEIQQKDIEIQLKRTTAFSDRNTALRAYQSMLRTQVSTWSVSEKDSLAAMFVDLKAMCDNISPRLFPAGLRLIKIKTGFYGQDVFYTRGNCIMVPENIFQKENLQMYKPVLLHEIFHVISRYQPRLRQDLYALIGFRPLPQNAVPDSILIPTLLTNPDGVSRNYAVKLFIKMDTMLVLPVIKTKFSSYKPETPSYFDYLSFDLYEVRCTDNVCRIVCRPNGTTTVPGSFTASFFKNIRDNTQYIIHPDEVMADNFMLALLATANDDFSKFSKEGHALILKVIDRLKQE